MPSLLTIPLRTPSDVDLGAELSDIITKEFYQTPSGFQADIDYISSLRHKVYLSSSDIGVTESSIEPFIEYYIHLASLLWKFPTDFASFLWSSGNLAVGYTSNNLQMVTQRSLLFEQIHVVYNIGALHSLLGLSQSEPKKGSAHFQQASGCFKQISTILLQNEELSESILPSDLQLDVISFLRLLCLAQAQEFAWLHALNTGIKNSILAKLAAQVSVLYDESLQFLSQCHSFRLRSDWSNHIKTKILYFQAISQYRQAILCGTEQEYGEEIARLRVAILTAKQCKSHYKYLPINSELKKEITSFLETLESSLSSCEKDNDLIYLKVVPEEKTLKRITPANIVDLKILPQLSLPGKYLSIDGSKGTFRPLFADLLPYYVIQVAQGFRERTERFIRQRIEEPLSHLSAILDKCIARNVPTAALPLQIEIQIEEIRSLGGIESIRKALNDVVRLGEQNAATVRGMKQKLEMEAAEDDMLRSRYGTNFWTRPRSQDVNGELINEVQMFDDLLRQALEGDRVIKEEYLRIKDAITLMCNSLAGELEKLIPEDDNPVSNEMKSKVAEAASMKNYRKRMIEVAETKASQMNVLAKVILEYKRLQTTTDMLSKPAAEIDFGAIFESVYEQHIKGFTDDMRAVEEEGRKQDKLEKEIVEISKRLEEQEGAEEKQEFFEVLENQHQQYMKLIDNLKEGLQFYNDFVVRANSCVQKIDSFIDERRREAQVLEEKIAN